MLSVECLITKRNHLDPMWLSRVPQGSILMFFLSYCVINSFILFIVEEAFCRKYFLQKPFPQKGG